jgi:hypothetical protein
MLLTSPIHQTPSHHSTNAVNIDPQLEEQAPLMCLAALVSTSSTLQEDENLPSEQ